MTSRSHIFRVATLGLEYKLVYLQNTKIPHIHCCCSQWREEVNDVWKYGVTSFLSTSWNLQFSRFSLHIKYFIELDLNLFTGY